MIQIVTCPDPHRLRELLDNSMTSDEQAVVISHLDQCECCQQKLEHIASGGSSFVMPICTAKADRPDETSAFWPALDRVQSAILSANDTPHEPRPLNEDEELVLDFLSPSEAPEYLGRLGHYEVMEVIGHGGMGVVLKAFDPCLQRNVALKVLAPRFAKNEISRKRFCREARAAASITHENVVAVYEVDEDENEKFPYLVLQLVEGESLQQRLDRVGKLDLKTILRFGYQIAAGLAAAHEQGLVHRDIKPANILIESTLERIKLTDFGLAKGQEDVSLTQTGFVAGTPLYMAPEQAKGETVDHRADLFSLGSVLYAMCTGKPPFEGSTPFVILKNVTEKMPLPMRTINPEIPDWFVEVVAKLQAKNPDKRYQTAAEVAQLLNDELTHLHPSGRSSIQTPCTGAKKVWHVGVMAWTAVGVMLAGFLATELTGLTRVVSPMFHTVKPEVTETPKLILDGKAGPIWSVAFTPDGKTVATAIDDGTIKLWDAETGGVRGVLEGHKAAVIALAISSDGKLLATGSEDGTAKLWDLDTGKEVRTIPHAHSVRALAFSPDGTRLVTGSHDGGVRIFGTANGEQVVTTKGHDVTVKSVAWSPDGKTIASGSNDKTVKLWDAKTGLARYTLQDHMGGVYAVAFTPNSEQVVSGGWDKTIRVWDVATGKLISQMKGHTQDIWTINVCPFGDHVVSGSEDHTVKVWELSTGKLVKSCRGHDGTVYSVAFSKNAKLAASGSRDGTAKLWKIEE